MAFSFLARELKSFGRNVTQTLCNVARSKDYAKKIPGDGYQQGNSDNKPTDGRFSLFSRLKESAEELKKTARFSEPNADKNEEKKSFFSVFSIPRVEPEPEEPAKENFLFSEPAKKYTIFSEPIFKEKRSTFNLLPAPKERVPTNYNYLLRKQQQKEVGAEPFQAQQANLFSRQWHSHLLNQQQKITSSAASLNPFWQGLKLKQDTPTLFKGVSSKNDSFCLRPANKDDHSDVVEMSRDVYDGFDYMVPLYQELCEDPNVRMVMVDLAQQFGKKTPIGMFAGSYTPDDASMFVYGWRIHRDYRGRGIGQAIKPHFYTYLKDTYDFQTLLSLRSYKPGWDKEVILDKAAEFAANYTCLYYKCDKDSVMNQAHRFMDQTDFKDTSFLNTQYDWYRSQTQMDVCSFLNAHAYNGYLVNGILSIPVEVKTGTVNTMFQSSNMVAVTRSEGRQINATSFGYVTEKPLESCTHLDILYYGRDDSTQTLKKHVASQIKHLKGCDKNLVVTVQFNHSISTEEVRASLKDLLGPTFEVPPPYNNPDLVLAKYNCKE